jgi:hypothetical protein
MSYILQKKNAKSVQPDAFTRFSELPQGSPLWSFLGSNNLSPPPPPLTTLKKITQKNSKNHGKTMISRKILRQIRVFVQKRLKSRKKSLVQKSSKEYFSYFGPKTPKITDTAN